MHSIPVIWIFSYLYFVGVVINAAYYSGNKFLYLYQNLQKGELHLSYKPLSKFIAYSYFESVLRIRFLYAKIFHDNRTQAVIFTDGYSKLHLFLESK